MKTLKWFGIIAVVAVAAFLIGTAVSSAFAQGGRPWGNWGRGGGMMGGYYGGQTGAFGPGMMGGYAPNATQPYSGTYGYGPGMMGGGMMGRGMMGGYYSGNVNPNATPITLDQAVTRAQQYVASLNNSDLQLVEVEEYADNFYGVVREKSTAIDAFQFLMDKYSGAVYPEMGPNMMWNTKYSPMARMLGGFWNNAPSAEMPISMTQAHDDAAQFLKTYLPNTTVEDQGDTFYGYYNFDVLQNDKTFGMLSVNGYTGQVWYHTWHGAFIASSGG